MKRIFTLLMAAASLMACTRTPYEEQIEIPGGFTATIEGVDTRTSMDGLKVLWASGDQVAVFAGKAINERYEVTKASVGKPSANFTKVGSSEGFGSTIPTNVAYYPYSSDVELDWSGEAAIYATLPETQTYAAGSFGQGAFPMMAVTKDASDRDFAFRNVCGVLKIQLTGSQKVKTIEFQGNDDEVISGDAVITSSYGDAPSIQMTGNGKAITLDCGAGVQLGSTPTDFCIALPPVTFGKGFTVTVTDTDGMTMEISTDKSQTISRSGILKMPAKEYDGTSSTDKASKELCFTAEKANSTIALNKEGGPYDVPQEYCTDGEHWYPYTFGTAITLANVGDKVYFRKMTDGVADGFSKGYDYNGVTCNRYHFTMSGRLAASGNVMSLVDRTCQSTTIPNDWCFIDLFLNCRSLTQAPELPATTLASSCYVGMFIDCTYLTQAPELPATTLAENCYAGMFDGCRSLTQAPELPATTLASYCYSNMFYGCAALTQAPELPATALANSCYNGMFCHCKALAQAPELPATALANSCYNGMFIDCSALTQAPELPATTLASSCYAGMFNDCTYLTQAPELPAMTLAEECYSNMFGYCKALAQAPELPATTLAKLCYKNMFEGCTALTQAPELPTTTLAVGCYYHMFGGCTSLTQAPELPATTLAERCYYHMFYGCTSMIQAPKLPAKKLVKECYYNMFFGCTSLNEVRCYATDISASDATTSWLYNVSSTGTFYADPSANWSRGGSGIPTGWTVKSLDGTSSTGQASKELCFTAETAGSVVALNKEGSPYNVPQEYCTDGEHWYPYTFGTPITLANVGEKVYFRRITDGVAGGFSKWYSDGLYNNYYHFSMSGRFAASGSVMSLVDRSCQSTIIPRSYYFYKLFEGCTALTQAPELPATTMADHCYDFMFHDCTALVQAPKLPATTLADYCYDGMFYGCTALTQAPELPATSLTEECYGHMFSGCTALTQAPELPATGLADWCYAGMFEGCTALTKAPELPATNLADCCYAIMFSGCTALTKAPELPATMLASWCYDEMFYGCTALTQAPELPATTLTESCYIYMFNGCTALKEVKCYAIDISSYGATANWLSGVSSTGTFYADPITNWERGTSGIPEGWTVKTLSE